MDLYRLSLYLSIMPVAIHIPIAYLQCDLAASPSGMGVNQPTLLNHGGSLSKRTGQK